MVKNTSRNIFFTILIQSSHKKHIICFKKKYNIYIDYYKCIIYIYTREYMILVYFLQKY